MFEIDRESYENGNHGKKVNITGVLVPNKYVFVF